MNTYFYLCELDFEDGSYFEFSDTFESEPKDAMWAAKNAALEYLKKEKDIPFNIARIFIRCLNKL